MKKDMKEALSNGLKPDLTHVRKASMIYEARGKEYGDYKYERGNYLRPTGSTQGDFVRFREYLRAAMSHLVEVTDSMERHLAQDPCLEDIEGMKTAAYAVDTDSAPGAKVGASLLPHCAAAAASLSMAITQAVEYGLLPRDPGQTWHRGDVTIRPGKFTEEVKPFSAKSDQIPKEILAMSDVPDAFEDKPKPSDDCPHGRPCGLACKECGGWARRAE